MDTPRSLSRNITRWAGPFTAQGWWGGRVFSDNRPVGLPASSILNTINGAVIHLDNQSFAIRRRKVAYVIDRELFDKELGSGLNIVYGTRFLGLETKGAGYIVDTDKDRFEADIVIGADGASSVVRAILNPDTADIRICKGVQLRISTRPSKQHITEVFLQKNGFVWIVPESDSIIRTGTISSNPYQDLEIFLKERHIKGTVIEKFGGLVSIGICKTTVRDNIAIAGDAASQIKPISYGGIYFGIKAATILAACIRRNRIIDYDRLWKAELEQEIRIGIKIREFYDRLKSDELAKLFGILKSKKEIIEKLADFENHSRIILSLIKEPALHTRIDSLLTVFLKSL